MISVPTLSPAGWVEDIVSKANKLTEYFFHSEASQSGIYRNVISSFPDLVQKYGSVPDRLEDEVKRQLQTYLSRYFTEVQINVTSDNLDSKDGRYNLTLDIYLIEDGKQHSLGRLIEIGESQIINIQERQ